MHITTMKQCLLFWLPDLSSYIPKHSVDFSTWQEHKHNSSVSEEDSSGQQTQMTEEVMVSPPPPPLFTPAGGLVHVHSTCWPDAV